jgi:3-hydroxy-9,10-secoandrosta-1,3,5(10)-triene-9,17-dione monooxygenase
MKATLSKQTPSYQPTREELVLEARKLVPVLRERAEQTEDLGRIPDETIADIKAAGLHKIYAPRRYGGFEMDWGTHVDVSRELAKGCGSTGWISSIVLSHTWMLARFPAETQEAFWPDHPDAIIATASAGGGGIEETEGGYIVNGRWGFASGVDHADCVLVPAKKDGMPTHHIMLLPGEFEILHTWVAEGLKGTGSNDVAVADQFVPASRVIEHRAFSGRNPPGSKLHDKYIYHTEMPSYFGTLLAGPLLGTARGGLEQYLDATIGRVGAMRGESIVDQVPVQIVIGEVESQIDAADLMVDNLCSMLHKRGLAGEQLVGTERLRSRQQMAYVARQCHDAVNKLSAMMGVTGQIGRNPVQRHFRDCRTISTHGSVHYNNSMALAGKKLLRVPTGDKLIDEHE